MASVVTAEWTRAQGALRAEVDRVTALLRSVRNPAAPALGRWNLAEVAMHLSQTWIVVPGLARDDPSAGPGSLAPAAGGGGDSGSSLLADLWELPEMTTSGVEADGERDPRVLADRIEERAADFLADLRGMSALEVRPWLLEGTRVRLPVLTCHLLNETVVHGYDMARADGRRWPVEPSHAALVFEGFLLPMLQMLEPRVLVDQNAAAGLRATYELHLRGAGRHLFTFDDGALTVEPFTPAGRQVDCHISADPAALLLVAWARKSQWAAIGRGQLVAWGRRPWLGPRLRALLRNP